MVEKSYTEMVKSGKTDEAAAMLDGYTRDFFGATVLAWDQLGGALWRANANGF